MSHSLAIILEMRNDYWVGGSGGGARAGAASARRRLLPRRYMSVGKTSNTVPARISKESSTNSSNDEFSNLLSRFFAFAPISQLTGRVAAYESRAARDQHGLPALGGLQGLDAVVSDSGLIELASLSSPGQKLLIRVV